VICDTDNIVKLNTDTNKYNTIQSKGFLWCVS
jgi:hypothetical protein